MCIDNDSIKTDTLPDGERPNSLEDLVQAPSNSPCPQRSKISDDTIKGNYSHNSCFPITIPQIMASGTLNPAQMGDLASGTPAVATRLSPLAIKSIHNSLAQSTWRSYFTSFMQFNIWCIVNGISSLPTTPETVSNYLSELAHMRKSHGTLQGIASAIAYFHRCLEIQSPTDSQKVRSTLRGIGRMDGPSARQADPLTPEIIIAIRRVACKPRIGLFGLMESAEYALHRGLVDIAVCSTSLFAGLRRSEAVSLTWADVEPQEDGSGLINIRRSKTSQFGEQEVVAIPGFVLADIEAIRPSHTDIQGRVFGLGAQQINSRIKRAVAVAGITGNFSSHSGRVGMAIYLQKKGAPDHIIRRQRRWKDSRMIDHYTKRAKASLVLPYFDQDQ